MIIASSKKNISCQYIALFFFLFGGILRLIQYLNNRSLWYDEASLALNLLQRSYLELLAPLDYNQAAPPGFLWLEKLTLEIFGNSEFVLRLFPFAASVVSLAVFYKLAQRYISPIATPIAMALFASLPYTLYYATEVKQYSSDMMVALLLCLWLIPLRQRILERKNILFLSLVGAIAIWLSHPAVFILSGIELGYLLTSQFKSIPRLLRNRLPIYITWLFSFGLMYWLSLSNTMGDDTLAAAWRDRFPSSAVDFVWLLDSFGRFFYRPLGFSGIADAFAIFAFIIGCVAFYRTHRAIFVALLAPFIMTFIASYLKQYPFRERLVIFLAPLAILIIAQGIAYLLDLSQHQRRYTTILGLIVLGAVVFPPLTHATQLAIQPELKHEIRPVIAYVKSQQQPGDYLYIYHDGKNQFLYYAPQYGYSPEQYQLGDSKLPRKGKADLEKWQRYQQEIDQLRNYSRVWLLYRADNENREQFSEYLNQLGQQLDFFEQPGAFVFLFDFAQESD